jgi:hypothetical protein
MVRRKKRILLVVTVATICVATMLILPIPRLSAAGTHPSVQKLKRPFKQVDVEYYLDGGSIGIRVVDAVGVTNLFALPVMPDGKAVYERLVPGTMSVTRTNSLPSFSLDTRTRAYLCRVIEMEKPRSTDGIIGLIRLRGAPRDYGRAAVEGVKTSIGSRID